KQSFQRWRTKCPAGYSGCGSAGFVSLPPSGPLACHRVALTAPHNRRNTRAAPHDPAPDWGSDPSRGIWRSSPAPGQTGAPVRGSEPRSFWRPAGDPAEIEPPTDGTATFGLGLRFLFARASFSSIHPYSG